MSNGTSMYRNSGRTMRPVKWHLITAMNFDRAVTNGMCVFSAAGNKAFKLTCVSAEKGAPVTIHSVIHREYFASGSAVNLATRFLFVKSEINATPGSPLYVPKFQTLGIVDVLATDYELIEDDGSTTNGTSQAEITGINLQIFPGEYTKEVFVVVKAMEGSKTYAPSCEAETEFFIEQH